MDKAAIYRITVNGVVPESWVSRLGGMQIVAVSDSQTKLEGWLPDQAALKGVLDSLYDFHLSIEKITRMEASDR